ncbi:metallophosphoesterase [Echinicola strongylocentroti]|uniref:Metallophosphoesterase n=1 Tax=Echinicola strongylocentroti TaxID=1795355 RepID=A0A2Z4IED1_9BACT|nr:metallophosphoesterase family protein [Echinicola strongylocentroti]AWW28773.1 metallophosphoesterase [Echinicola strongylocentroti]
MINSKALILSALMLCLISGFQQESFGKVIWDQDTVRFPDKAHLMPTAKPDRIILNLAANPLEEVGINWRTATSESTSYLQFAVATAGPAFSEKAENVTAKTTFLETQQDDEPVIKAHYHEVDLTGLTPGQTYVYRVGSDKAWSEWFQFKMPKQEGPVSLFYFGDAQNDVSSKWSRVIREASFQFPRVDFMLYAGDLINHEDADFEWGGWFEAGGFVHASVPVMMTPGNHEYAKGVILSKHWKPQFNLPENGPEGLEEMAYEVNYPELKVISLDAEQIDEIPAQKMAQVKWLRDILENNPKKWTIITFHYPIYSTKPNRINEDMLEYIKPVLEEYDVDMVLQGHDHAYARGRVTTKNGEEVLGEGPMYVVSVSGPKMYDIGDDPWMDRRAYMTQLFQWINIDGDQLEYQALTATGELYDAFQLKKNDQGQNELINQIPTIKERIQK